MPVKWRYPTNTIYTIQRWRIYNFDCVQNSTHLYIMCFITCLYIFLQRHVGSAIMPKYINRIYYACAHRHGICDYIVQTKHKNWDVNVWLSHDDDDDDDDWLSVKWTLLPLILVWLETLIYVVIIEWLRNAWVWSCDDEIWIT